MLLGELAAILSAAVWAFASLAMVGPARRVPSVTVSTVKMVGGLAFFLVLVVASGHVGALFSLGGGRLFGLLASAIIGFGAGDTLYIAGQHRTGAAIASPISVTVYPLLTILLAWLLLGDTLALHAMLGGLLTLAGILVLLLWPSGAQAPRDERALAAARTAVPAEADTVGAAALAMAPAKAARPRLHWNGVLLVLGATVAWSCSTVWLQELTTNQNTIVVNAVRTPAVLLAVGGFAALHGDLGAVRRLSRRDLWLVALVAGVLGSGLSSLAYVYAVQNAGSGLAALLNSLSPVLALPLAVLWLKERVTTPMIAGTLLSLAGVWLVLA